MATDFSRSVSSADVAYEFGFLGRQRRGRGEGGRKKKQAGKGGGADEHGKIARRIEGRGNPGNANLKRS
jgi:hypothetical protein